MFKGAYLEKKVLIWSSLVVFILLFSINSYGFEIVQLTFNTYDDGVPSAYKGTIAWEGFDGNDTEIFYWNGEDIQQITNNDYDDHSPKLYEGKITWLVRDNITYSYEIFYWNGTSISSYPLPIENTLSLRTVSVFDGKAAWTAIEKGDPCKDPSCLNFATSEVYYWDGQKPLQITNDSNSDNEPSLYNGQIAWTAEDGVYYWDGSKITQILETRISEDGVSLCDGEVTFSCNDKGDIYHWNNGILSHVITGKSNISGEPDGPYNGTLVFEGGLNRSLNYWDGDTIKIIDENTSIGYDIHDNIIAWAKSDGTDHEIFYAKDIGNQKDPTDPVDPKKESDVNELKDQLGLGGCFISSFFHISIQF